MATRKSPTKAETTEEAKVAPVIGVAVDSEISHLPGFGRRDQISLSEFVRDGLETPGNLSWIRSHKRYTERIRRDDGGSKVCPNGYDAEAVCAACKRTVYEFTPGLKPSDTLSHNLEYVRVVSARKGQRSRKDAVWFCFDCAQDRNAMVNALHKMPRYAAMIAADGQDVFAFIAETIREDRACDAPDYTGPNLRLHAGIVGKVGSPQNMSTYYGNVIGGRMLYYRNVDEPRDLDTAARTVAAAEAERKRKEAAEAKKAEKAKPKQ